MTLELYLLWLCHGNRAGLWILEGFLSVLPAFEDEAFVWRIATQMGTYLICIGPLRPGSDLGEPETVIELGRDITVNAWNRNRAWFNERELGCLFSRVL